MKIKLFYIHPTNYGNLMMACAFMKYYTDISQQKKSETPEFYLDVLDDEELNRVKASLPDSDNQLYYRHTEFGCSSACACDSCFRFKR